MLRNYLSVLVLVSVVLTSSRACASLLNSASYSFSYVNLAGFGDMMVGPVPTPLNATEQTPTARLTFDVNAVPATYTELAARASVSIEAQPALGDIRDLLRVSAEANASISTLGTVQNVGSATSGQVVYSWIVSGVTDIAFAPIQGDVEVHGLSVLTILSASEPGGGLPFTELRTFPNAPTITDVDFSEEYPTATDALLFTKSWDSTNGVNEVAIDFDLSVTLEGIFENLDATGYDATFGGDFANTAELLGVLILDESGNEIPGATLVTEDGFTFPSLETTATPIGSPEPATWLVWLVFVIIGLGAMLGRNRTGRSARSGT